MLNAGFLALVAAGGEVAADLGAGLVDGATLTGIKKTAVLMIGPWIQAIGTVWLLLASLSEEWFSKGIPLGNEDGPGSAAGAAAIAEEGWERCHGKQMLDIYR